METGTRAHCVYVNQYTHIYIKVYMHFTFLTAFVLSIFFYMEISRKIRNVAVCFGIVEYSPYVQRAYLSCLFR